MELGTEAARRRFGRRGLGGAIRLESLFVLILLIAALSVLSPYFLSISNALNILLATAVIGILGFASTLVIAAAGIDLSVGSILGFGGVVGALAVNVVGLPWPLGILAALAGGALCGLINGVLVARAAIPAFIATLGMLGVARGAALVLTNGQPVYGLPEAIIWLGQGRPLGIPVPAIAFLGVAVVTHFILARTRFGTYALVIGDNQAVARATGIYVERHLIMLYTLSGLLAGLAGLISAARVNSGDPTAGTGYELSAITAAILGGTNLFGGRASVVGTLIGALIMGVLQNGLNLLAVSSFYQQMAIGIVLVLAVWLDQVNRARRRV